MSSYVCCGILTSANTYAGEEAISRGYDNIDSMIRDDLIHTLCGSPLLANLKIFSLCFGVHYG